jgi:sigma-B regulation protein RsbU (phosphoserine phosphatase)
MTPVADAHLSQDAPARLAAAGGGPAPSVLVVDDNAENRDVLRRRLERDGYALSVAASGPEALRLLSERAFDLVLLDVMMPGMSGLEVLERLRRDRSAADLPVIMATAKDRSEDVVEALALGANDYVTKPLDFQVVMARVGTQLSLGQSVKRIRRLEQRLSQRNAELEAANAELLRTAERTRAELEMAAKVQKALLPTALPVTPGLTFAWACHPCQELAGDSLNVCRFDDGRVGAYVLDVSGHGVAASLMAVAATRLLTSHGPDSVLVEGGGGGASDTPGGDCEKRPVAPATVAKRLDERFRWDDAIAQFITVFYAVIDASSRELTYVSAGHPGAILVGRPPTPTTVLDQSGMPIGLGDVYEQSRVPLRPGDRVYLYSDGVIESLNPDDQQFGTPRLVAALERQRGATLAESVAAVVDEVRDWAGGLHARDDISILACECDCE